MNRRSCAAPTPASSLASVSRPSASNDLRDDAGGVEAGLRRTCASGLSCSMKRSGRTMRADLQAASSAPRSARSCSDVAAEAADRAFLDRDQHLVLAREPQRSAPRRAAWRSGRRRRWSRGRARRAPRRPSSAFGEPGAEATGARRACPSRTIRPLPIGERHGRARAGRRRRPRRADSGRRSGRRRRRRRSPPCGRARPRRRPPSRTKPGRQPR